MAWFRITGRGRGRADAGHLCSLHRQLARFAGRLVHNTREYEEPYHAAKTAGSFGLVYGRTVDHTVLRHAHGGALGQAACAAAVQRKQTTVRDRYSYLKSLFLYYIVKDFNSLHPLGISDRPK